MRTQIAHTRAYFERFSAMSENRETGWWRETDLNRRPLPQSLRGKFCATLAEYLGWETGGSAAENLIAGNSPRIPNLRALNLACPFELS